MTGGRKKIMSDKKQVYVRKIPNIFYALVILFSFSLISWNLTTFGNSLSNEYIKTAMQDILVLMIAYPETIKSIEYKNNRIYLIMQSGNKILYDDMEAKTFKDKLLNADVQDMLEQIYPIDQPKITPVENFEPGRIRCYDFFYEIYGKSEEVIKKQLVKVKTPFGKFLFNGKYQASSQFEKAMNEIHGITQKQPEILKFVVPIKGTYIHRSIKGLDKLSTHAFGIAIDLNDKNNKYYWYNNSRKQLPNLLKDYPESIVETFEKYGFIWGGKWWHYDLMHFEYRPELILKAKYFSKPDTLKIWYGEVPYELYSKYIKIIENAFKKR